MDIKPSHLNFARRTPVVEPANVSPTQDITQSSSNKTPSSPKTKKQKNGINMPTRNPPGPAAIVRIQDSMRDLGMPVANASAIVRMSDKQIISIRDAYKVKNILKSNGLPMLTTDELLALPKETRDLIKRLPSTIKAMEQLGMEPPAPAEMLMSFYEGDIKEALAHTKKIALAAGIKSLIDKLNYPPRSVEELMNSTAEERTRLEKIWTEERNKQAEIEKKQEEERRLAATYKIFSPPEPETKPVEEEPSKVDNPNRLCPHPYKIGYVTEELAWLAINIKHPDDDHIAPYDCVCGTKHIGHSRYIDPKTRKRNAKMRAANMPESDGSESSKKEAIPAPVKFPVDYEDRLPTLEKSMKGMNLSKFNGKPASALSKKEAKRVRTAYKVKLVLSENMLPTMTPTEILNISTQHLDRIKTLSLMNPALTKLGLEKVNVADLYDSLETDAIATANHMRTTLEAARIKQMMDDLGLPELSADELLNMELPQRRDIISQWTKMEKSKVEPSPAPIPTPKVMASKKAVIKTTPSDDKPNSVFTEALKSYTSDSDTACPNSEKDKFLTYAHALKAAGRNRRGNLTPYRCVCNSFHLGFDYFKKKR